MNDEDLKRFLDRHSTELAEHFDSVRIFVTRHGDRSTGTTLATSVGAGNIYAQIGQIQEWVKVQNALAIQDALSDDEEEG